MLVVKVQSNEKPEDGQLHDNIVRKTNLIVRKTQAAAMGVGREQELHVEPGSACRRMRWE